MPFWTHYSSTKASKLLIAQSGTDERRFALRRGEALELVYNAIAATYMILSVFNDEWRVLVLRFKDQACGEES